MKLILFDLGGVLIELNGLFIEDHWTEHNIDSVKDYWFNSHTAKKFESGKSDPHTFAHDMISELNLSVGKKEFLQRFRQWPGHYFPGVQELIDSLKEKYSVACLSNSNEIHWERAVSEWKVQSLFDFSFASHIIGHIKPEPEIFHYVIEETGYRPEDIIFFDDNIMNVKAAESLGIKSFHTENFDRARTIARALL